MFLCVNTCLPISKSLISQGLAIQRTPLNWSDSGKIPDMALEPPKATGLPEALSKDEISRANII